MAKSKVQELREKIAARKTERAGEQKAKYAKMRLVAEKAPEKLEACLAGLATKCAGLAEGWENLRENLGLVRAAKDTPLKVRVAAARNYAKQFRQVAEEAPDELAKALVEAYEGLNDIAADIERAAQETGVDLEAGPQENIGDAEEINGGMPDFEAPEEEPEPEAGPEVEEEIIEASASDAWVTDRDDSGQPKAPVLANSGNDAFVTDRDKGGPKKPAKLDIPRAQGESEVGKEAAGKTAMSRKDYIIIADSLRSFKMPNDMREQFARHISQALRSDNHRFQEGIFVDYVMGKGGSRGGNKFKGDQPNTPETLFV